jgi:hypothetical protein
MGVAVDDTLMAAVVERSGHQYMLEHSSMFDEHWITSQQAALGRWGIGGRPATAAGTYTQPLVGSLSAAFVTETTQGIPSKVLTFTRKVFTMS